MRLRRGQRGFGHHNTEAFIFIVIISILAAVLLPYFLNRGVARARTCLGQLVAATEGATGAKCPACSQPYPAGDALRCPGDHLATKPVFVRSGDAWQFGQELPPFTGATQLPIADLHLWAEIARTDDRVTLTLRPRAWWRFALGPLLTLIGLVILVALLNGVREEARSKQRSAFTFFFFAVGLAIAGWATWQVTASIWGRQTLEFTRNRIEHHVFVADRELFAPTVYAPVKALVPVKNSSKWRLVLVHGDKDVRATVELRTVSESGLGAVSLMHEALFGSK